MTKGRINARLGPALANKVAALRSRTRKTTTEVVIEALNRYHAELEREGGDPVEILSRAGFIGCATGPKNLSIRYKSELGPSLRKKS